MPDTIFGLKSIRQIGSCLRAPDARSEEPCLRKENEAPLCVSGSSEIRTPTVHFTIVIGKKKKVRLEYERDVRGAEGGDRSGLRRRISKGLVVKAA